MIAALTIYGCGSSEAPKEGDNPVAQSSQDASTMGDRAASKESAFGGGAKPMAGQNLQRGQ